MQEAKSYSSKEVTIVLVGNKADLQAERVVTVDEAQEFARQHAMICMETSAKSGMNVNWAFASAAEAVLGKIENGVYDLTNENCGIKLGSAEKQGYSLKGREEPEWQCKC